MVARLVCQNPSDPGDRNANVPSDTTIQSNAFLLICPDESLRIACGGSPKNIVRDIWKGDLELINDTNDASAVALIVHGPKKALWSYFAQDQSIRSSQAVI
jgi:hypothetical protein